MVFFGFEFREEPVDVGLFGDICDNGNNLAFGRGVQLSDTLEFLFGAPDDVHFCAVDGEGLHGH